MELSPEAVELIASLRQEIAMLRAEVVELRRQLGQDSSTSSKPPSSDGLKKKPRIAGSLRGFSGQASGGQKGHKGQTLRQVCEPDVIVPRTARACRHCRAPLDETMRLGVEKRQVFDLAERPLLVTEHQAAIYRCACCRRQITAAFPDGVTSPAQYGERIRAAAIYLNVQQLVPEDRTAQALNDLFGASCLSAASVAAWGRKKAQDLERVYAQIGARAAAQKVRHVDETGLRIAGKLSWLHTTSSAAFTFYRAGVSRGAVPTQLQGGVVVHDHFRPYYGLRGVAHAMCNAHHLRELKGLIEFDRETWAEQMRDTLLEANAAVRTARAAGATFLPAEKIKAFVARFWDAVRFGFAFHRSLPKLPRNPKAGSRVKRRPGLNLLLRFKKYKDATLRFLTDFDVPFTNNLAEQDLRMMKVKMKISGAFRTLQGAKDFACLRSVVSTARKQGCNILETLAATPGQLATALFN
jgi:transposase